MGTDQLRFVGAGLFFLFIFLSGFGLSRSGKPYNQIIFNMHKLTALAAVLLFIIAVHRTNRVTPLSAVEVIAAVVTGFLALGLFVTGALVSIDKPMPAIVSKLHHVTPYLTVLFTVATLYLLQGREL